MTLSRIRRLALAAAASAAAAVSFSAAAQAAGPQILSTNSGRALEAQFDGRVKVATSNVSALRQRWLVETGANGKVRYRNEGLPGSCLVTPPDATASSVNNLALGPCFGIGARNLWSPLTFNTAGGFLQSAQTSQLASEPLCIDSSPCDDFAHVVPASFAPLEFILRWRLR